MAPPAATAAGRLSPNMGPRSIHIDPVVPPEVEPDVIRNASPNRIRGGRIPKGGGALRPRDRRWSGPARRVPAGSAVAFEAISLERATTPNPVATAVERIEFPRISVPNPFHRRALRVPTPSAVVEVVRTAPDHPMTNYLVASRVWVGLVATLAAGLVFIQVQLLHTNAGIGTNVQRITSLQRENAELRTTVSGLSSDQRIVAEAQRMGFVEPPVGSSRFTAYHRGDSQRALAVLSTPATGTGMSDASVSQPDSSGSTGDVYSGPSSSVMADTSQGSGESSASSQANSGSSTDSSSGASTTAAVPDGGSSPQSG